MSDEDQDYEWELVIRRPVNRIIGSPPIPPDVFTYNVTTKPSGGRVPLYRLQSALATVMQMFTLQHDQVLTKNQKSELGQAVDQMQRDVINKLRIIK